MKFTLWVQIANIVLVALFNTIKETLTNGHFGPLILAPSRQRNLGPTQLSRGQKRSGNPMACTPSKREKNF